MNKYGWHFLQCDLVIIIRLSSHTDRNQVLAQPTPHNPVDSDLVLLTSEVAKAISRH